MVRLLPIKRNDTHDRSAEIHLHLFEGKKKKRKVALAKSAAPGGRLAHLPSYQAARSVRP